jgi:hypothetical protein
MVIIVEEELMPQFTSRPFQAAVVRRDLARQRPAASNDRLSRPHTATGARAERRAAERRARRDQTATRRHQAHLAAKRQAR